MLKLEQIESLKVPSKNRPHGVALKHINQTVYVYTAGEAALLKFYDENATKRETKPVWAEEHPVKNLLWQWGLGKGPDA